MNTSISTFNRAGQEGQEWVNQIARELNQDSEQAAYHALRGVLFALRDRLPPEEAVHLGDELPTLVRGVYYEAYNLGSKPEKIRQVDEFLDKIRQETDQVNPSPSPQAALQAVTHVLADHIDGGQYGQVKQALPAEIQQQLGA